MTLTPAQRVLRGISEAQWQQQVVELAQWCGWRYYHAPDNRPVNGRVQNVKAGFPDLVLTRGGRLLFVELKRELGKLSDEQVAWLDALGLAPGVETYCWRPSDLSSVRAVLS